MSDDFSALLQALNAGQDFAKNNFISNICLEYKY